LPDCSHLASQTVKRVLLPRARLSFCKRVPQMLVGDGRDGFGHGGADPSDE
jgi:hypothetical protein